MRSAMIGLLSWMALTSAAAASDVVVGVAGLDASTTRVIAVDLDTAQHRSLGVVAHAAGATPVGTLLRNGQLALVTPNDGRLLLFDTSSAAVVETPTRQLSRHQRPQQDGVRVVGIRQNDGHPEVVDLFTDKPLFTVDAPWLSPVTNSTTVFITSGTGSSERLDWRAGTLRRRVLGPGTYRTPALRPDGSLLVDVQEPGSPRSQLVQIPADGTFATAKVIAAGLPGLSPIVAGARAAAASGRKDGSLVVDDGAGFVRWPGARVGIARPQAMTSTGALVVVALVDRGAALPAELWVLTKQGGTLLLAPAVGDVVTVYGIDGEAADKVSP